MMVLAKKASMIEAEEPIAAREKHQQGFKRKLNFKKLLSLAGCLLCLTVGNVIVQGLVVERNYQIQNLEQLVQKQERDMMKLKINIANLESFDRVQTIAQNNLGMKIVGPDDYQMIPAVPAETGDLLQPGNYVAQAGDQGGMLEKVTAWLGGIGRTMANTF
jgi:cell division protein FtsL